MHSGERWRLGRRPALDGVRAIAVLMVLVSHAGVPGTHQFGAIGVTVFFTLSGFLITSLLLEEQQAGRGSLRRFYLRRMARLGPALVACVALAVAVELVVVGAVRDWSLFAGALTWTTNFVMVGAPHWGDWPSTPLEHTWSLAVEEQFYLVWPLLLLGSARLPKQARLWGTISLALGSFLLGGQVGLQHQYLMLDTRACQLLAGAAVAIALTGSRRRSVPWGWSVPLVVAAVLVGVLDNPSPGPAFVAALLTAALLYVCACSSPGWLAWPRLAWLGVRSYGVYLYHVPVLMLCREITTSWWLLAPLAFALTGLLAAVSYRWVEEPVRAWGRRWADPSAGRVRVDESAEPREMPARVG